MIHEDNRTLVPPMIPWKKVMDVVEELEFTGVPRHIARQFLKVFATSGSSSISQIFHTLHFLGFAEGEDHQSTKHLRDFVQEKGARKARLEELLRTCYDPVMDEIGNLSTTTHKKIEEAFSRHYHIENDMRRKAISFFVHMARAAEIPLSPHVRTADNPHFRRGSSQIVKQERANRIPQQMPVYDIMQSDVAAKGSTSACLQETKRKTKTITFRAGGGLTFSYQATFSHMDEQDRIELFALIDCFRRFEQRAEQSQGNFHEETLITTFQNGAFVTASYAMDLLELDEQDRVELFALIDCFRRLEHTQGNIQRTVKENTYDDAESSEIPIVSLSSLVS